MLVVVLVHWAIKKGSEANFQAKWKTMTVDPDSGLFREIFTCPNSTTSDPKYHTFGLENPNYITFVNIGIWRSLEDFDKAIGKYIPEALPKGDMQVVEMYNFEFKIRERLVIDVLTMRGGDWQLPTPDL